MNSPRAGQAGRVVVKVQLALGGNPKPPANKALIYDKSKMYASEQILEPEEMKLMKGQAKQYFYGTFNATTGKWKLIDLAPWQRGF